MSAGTGAHGPEWARACSEISSVRSDLVGRAAVRYGPLMGDVELLESVLTKTAGLISRVETGQWELPTPCPDYNVRELVSHMVGWAQLFAASASGETFEGDPTAYAASEDAAQDFESAGARIVDGWRSAGFDRTVRMTSGELPAPMVFNMTLMEYLTHGWDLAVATSQPVPYSEAEAEETLKRAQPTLPDEYRGEGKPFGPRREADADADAVTRLVAFMGRDPRGDGS